MDKFNELTEEDRKTAFKQAAAEQGFTPVIMEKDFWVCWTLKQLFSDDKIGGFLTFKGGTSLSKAYGLIERFSEDIDLTVNRDAPFLKGGRNPMEDDISGKERGRRIKSLKENTGAFVKKIVLPVMKKRIKTSLGNHGNWSLRPDKSDNQTLLFHYPELTSEGGNGYIKQTVRLEFGARGEIEPNTNCTITPYVAEQYPNLFDSPKTEARTLAVERTFWEKVTILHALYHGVRMRDRMSRHYYDTYTMDKKGITGKALKDTGLLEKVVRNKSLLFTDKKASYKTAKIGSLKLLPDSTKTAELKSDYGKMSEMFTGKAPDFNDMVEGLKMLENKLNSTAP